MNTPTRGAVVFLDPAVVDTVLSRVASAAFAYYPGKDVEEVGYTVDEDVHWAIRRRHSARTSGSSPRAGAIAQSTSS